MGFSFTGDCTRSRSIAEGRNFQDNSQKIIKAGMDRNHLSSVNKLITTRLLPFAAEALNISPNLDDYIIVYVPILPCDIPNRKAISIPYREITSWNIDQGTIAYRTWIGKSCCTDHINTDLESNSKGLVFDTSCKELPGTYSGKKLYKVMALLGFDRSKFPTLANEILNGKRDAYSLGARAENYRCSIDNKPPNATKAPLLLTNDNQQMPVIDGKLAYWIASGITGFEISSLSPGVKGAYTSTDRVGFKDYGIQ